ncbi:UNVERIFIED_CONTAM: La-related protein 1A [Sesamum indicum]
MGMGENDGGGDQFNNHDFVVCGPPKSPWKTPAAASPVVDADSESWPALSDAQLRAKNNGGMDSISSKSPPLVATEVDGCGGALPAAQPATVEQQKFHGRGNIKSSRKPYPAHHRTGPKHGPNAVPPFPVRSPYYAPPVPPFFHSMVHMPPISAPGYAYPYPPRPFPRVDTQFVKSGSDASLPTFVPPANGVFHSSPSPDSSAHDSNSVGRRPDAKEQVGQRNPSWNNQRPLAINNNFHIQQTMGPRSFIRPPYYGPTGFIDGPNVSGFACSLPNKVIYDTGPPGTFYYFPGAVRIPYSPVLVPYTLGPGVLIPHSTIALRANIVKQIEYYFSDENLQNDPYLISLMDKQGWVPISFIADFKRVKRMNADIPFILEALQASETIEVQSSRTSEGVSEESKTLSSELASAISEGLYFYEQELNSERSHRIHNKPIYESEEENSRYSANDASALCSRDVDYSSGGNSCEGPGNSNVRRKQKKGSSKPQSIHKQRLFHGNFRIHGSGRNSLGVISESPPSDAVGFFFGSPPPDSHGNCKPQVTGLISYRGRNHKIAVAFAYGLREHLSVGSKKLRPSKLSTSPHSNLSGSSSPVGSMPKPFPPFQHPSHKLLEENGFKQQIYGLEKEFRGELYEDFEQLTFDFYKKGNLYGLEKYWAFHHFREARDHKEPLRKHPELDRLLRGEYRTLDDFNRVKARDAAVH